MLPVRSVAVHGQLAGHRGWEREEDVPPPPPKVEDFKHCNNNFPSLVPRPNPHAGKRVWCTSSNFLGFQDAKQSCDINYCHGNALSGMQLGRACNNSVASFAPLVCCHMKNHMP